MEIEDRLRSAIIQFAVRFYDVTLEDVLSPAKQRHVVHAKAMVVWLAKTYRPMATFAQIGTWLGKPHQNVCNLYELGQHLSVGCRHFVRGADEFAALYRTTMEVPYACA